jgi:hypothetical protein
VAPRWRAVAGVTLSDEQVALAKAQADERGLGSRVEFRNEDYRDVTGVFDRVVSIEMIENIGRKSYGTFFRKCADLLAEDGVILLHLAGRPEGPEISRPFISKYFFPDSYIPVLPDLLPAIQRAGLLVTDIEILRGHYAQTIKVWRERFLAHREEIERLYDARFFRGVGILVRQRGNIGGRRDDISNSDDQTPRSGAGHARLRCARRGAATQCRKRTSAAPQGCRRMNLACRCVAVRREALVPAPLRHALAGITLEDIKGRSCGPLGEQKIGSAANHERHKRSKSLHENVQRLRVATQPGLERLCRQS